MGFRGKIRAILFSWDSAFAFLVALTSFFVVPNALRAETARDLFFAGISVLAIIFSVYFAALAILITSGDNDFIDFLQEDGLYTMMVWFFRWTLSVIFIALLASILLYISTVLEIAKEVPGYYPHIITIPFIFLFSYSLFSALCSSRDAIQYAEKRAAFVHIKKNYPHQNIAITPPSTCPLSGDGNQKNRSARGKKKTGS